MTTATRPTRRLRPIHLVLSLLLAVGGALAASAPAQAAVDEITGMVVSLDPSHPIPSSVNIYLSAGIDFTAGAPTGPMFASAAPVTTTAPDGSYTIPGLTPGFVYFVLADGGDDWVQGFSATVVDGSVDPVIDDIGITPGVLITGIVHPESPGPGLPGIAVGAVATDTDPSCGCGGGFFGDDVYFDLLTFDWDLLYPQTPVGGGYRIVVPLGHTYEINAQDPSLTPNYEEQSWDHLSGSGGCICGGGDFTPVVIPDDSAWPYGAYAPTSAIDFDLRAFSDYLWFQVKTVRNPGPADYANVHVFLQYDFGGPDWQDVADDFSDSDGFVNFFVTDDGDYRLRFEVGGVEVPVVEAVDAIGCGCASTYLLSVSDTRVELGTYTKSHPGDGYFEGADAQVTFAAAPSSGGGGGTPAPPAPRKPPRTKTTFDITSIVTPIATPTPTPTSTPTPSSSPSASPSASPSPTPGPDDNQGDTGFPWWIILIIVLVIGVIILVIVLVRRR